MGELRGLGEVSAELQRQGGRLLAVAVDPPSDSRRVVKANRLDFAVLCDTDRKVIQTYNLVHKGGHAGSDIAKPAHILIDRDGRIVWRYESQRIQDRPHPAEVLKQVRALAGSG